MENDDLDRLVDAEREKLAEVIYDSYRLGKYGSVEYLPMWHELETKPTRTPEVHRAVGVVESIVAGRVSALVQRTRDAETRAQSVIRKSVPSITVAEFDRLEAERDAALARVGELEAIVDEVANAHGSAHADWSKAWNRAIAAESALSGLVDRITQLADEWEEAARTAVKRAASVSFDRRTHYADLSENYQYFESRLRALTATSSPSADTHADLFGLSVTEAIQSSSPSETEDE